MTMPLRLEVSAAEQALVVRPVGTLTLETYPDLRDGLLEFAAREPAGIVIELDDMSAEALPLTVLYAVSVRIDEWPGIPLVLVSTRQPMRRALDSRSISRFVRTYRSVDEALENIRTPPPRRRRRMNLVGTKGARQARREVAKACADWHLAAVTEQAVLVASELVENAIAHSTAPNWLRLELRRRKLTITVADADPRPPHLRSPAERNGGGRGLVLVDKLSRTWGYAPQPHGGKVVWAVLTIPAQWTGCSRRAGTPHDE